jgi:uncharacterized protein (DUF3820 family)
MPDEPLPSSPPSPAAREPTLQEAMRADLEAIGRTFMPFGKFGPQHFPPNGIPIYDLPAEYLTWFAQKNLWPKGRLGQLLQIVHQMKADGSDLAFDPLRRRAGGRSRLRPEKQRHFDCTDPQPPKP